MNAAEETGTGYLVVRVRETNPAEVTHFRTLEEARPFYDQARLQWTDVWLCGILSGPGNPPKPDGMTRCEHP